MSKGMQQFERNITYRLHTSENSQLVLTATLTDRFHDIALEVQVDPQTLTVQTASADFRKFPSGDCPNAAKALQKLPGLVIGKGMSRKLSEALGGIEGCGNLRNLLLGLLPLALNARAAAGCQNDEEALQLIHEQLLGTCAGYARPPCQNP